MKASKPIIHGSDHLPGHADPIPGLGICCGPGTLLETLFLSSLVSAGVTSSTILEDGREYLITAQGTLSLHDEALPVGTAEADAMFPTVGARTSTQVGSDPECIFAEPTGGTLGHTGYFLIDLGSGFEHIEPDTGKTATPVHGHLYSYHVTGQGSTVDFKINDIVYTDNYGKLKITIQSVGGSASGDGEGSLLPDPSGEPDGSLLQTTDGAALWFPIPGDASQYLDGSGNYSVPPGGSADWTIIADLELGSDQASFDTNTILGGNISSAYKHLALELVLRSDRAASQDGILLLFNNDGTSGNYKTERLNSFGASTGSSLLNGTSGGIALGNSTAASSPASSFSQHSVRVDNYNSSVFKMADSNGVSYYDGTTPLMQIDHQGGIWLSTNAITRLTVKPEVGSNWRASSRFTLYGLS